MKIYTIRGVVYRLLEFGEEIRKGDVFFRKGERPSSFIECESSIGTVWGESIELSHHINDVLRPINNNLSVEDAIRIVKANFLAQGYTKVDIQINLEKPVTSKVTEILNF